MEDLSQKHDRVGLIPTIQRRHSFDELINPFTASRHHDACSTDTSKLKKTKKLKNKLKKIETI